MSKLNKKGKLKRPSEAEMLQKLQQQQEEKKQAEIDKQNEEQFLMAMELSKWELEHGIKVESILKKPVKPDSVSFVAVKYMHKMTEEEKKQYQEIIKQDKKEYELYVKHKEDSAKGKKVSK